MNTWSASKSSFFHKLATLVLLVALVGFLNGCILLLPLIPDESSESEMAPQIERISYQPSDEMIVRPSFKPAALKVSPSREELRQRRMLSLIEDLRTGEPVVRVHAAFWLGEMGHRARKAVPVLVENLRHNHHWVRRASAKSLGKIRAKNAVPALRMSLKDRNKWVAHSAANSLEKINTKEARTALSSYYGS